ncbi:hypothetical protein CS022_11655 [Veronia nyctiphanis]|uniref:Uncharacterized protein n=1 Tax=Veronia nyctiphanis TaxID=1278244 RepID=A0A4Q0YPZ5_9GAMM|nr:hypothetical protein CS022_11655 [Veronia nyctiphanis]
MTHYFTHNPQVGFLFCFQVLFVELITYFSSNNYVVPESKFGYLATNVMMSFLCMKMHFLIYFNVKNSF